jgi:hypothetical protein
MNDKQNPTRARQDITDNKKSNNSRALIYIPLFFSIVFGLIFMSFSISNKGDDQSGLTYVVNGLIAGALFALSLLVSTICVLIGLVKLQRAKK